MIEFFNRLRLISKMLLKLEIGQSIFKINTEVKMSSFTGPFKKQKLFSDEDTKSHDF